MPTAIETPVERQFFSIGHLACHFQIPVAQVRSLLAAAGIGPSITLNDVPYYDGHGMIAVSRALRAAAEVRGDE